jgi:purine-binding chemotaxis protein CheW
MDLRKRFGEKQVALNKQNRILVVEHSGKLAGLIVDSASEVLKIPAADVEAPPSAFQEGGLNCVSGLGKVNGRLVVLLDMSKLLAPGSLLSAERTKKSKPAVNGEARGASAS